MADKTDTKVTIGNRTIDWEEFFTQIIPAVAPGVFDYLFGEDAPTLEPVELGDEYLGMMEGIWNQQMEMLGPIYDQLGQLLELQKGWAIEDRDRWSSVFRPLEDALVNDAETYATQGRRELEAQRAVSEVTKAFQKQRDNARRALESQGIDPSQTRTRALDAGFRAQEGAAQAAASNTARRYVDDTARALRAQAISLGQDTVNRALKAGQIAGNIGLGTGQLINQQSAIGGNLLATGIGLDQAAQANAFNQQLAALQFASQFGDRSPWESVYSGIQGVDWGEIFPPKEGPSDVETVPTASDNPFEGYGDVDAGNYATGGPVRPRAALPAPAPAPLVALPPYDNNGTVEGAGGPKDDLVPARLSPGEYVVPEEVVRWKGEEFFIKLRDKAQQDMMEEEQRNPPQFSPALPGQVG